MSLDLVNNLTSIVILWGILFKWRYKIVKHYLYYPVISIFYIIFADMAGLACHWFSKHKKLINSSPWQVKFFCIGDTNKYEIGNKMLMTSFVQLISNLAGPATWASVLQLMYLIKLGKQYLKSSHCNREVQVNNWTNIIHSEHNTFFLMWNIFPLAFLQSVGEIS